MNGGTGINCLEVFDRFNVAFPALRLRDHAVVLSPSALEIGWNLDCGVDARAGLGSLGAGSLVGGHSDLHSSSTRPSCANGRNVKWRG